MPVLPREAVLGLSTVHRGHGCELQAHLFRASLLFKPSFRFQERKRQRWKKLPFPKAPKAAGHCR